MKKMFAVVAVLVAAAMMFAGCGGSDSGGGATPVTSTTQGAQTAKSASLASGNVLNGAMGVSGQVGKGLSGPGAPKFEQTRAGKRMSNRIAKKLMPAIKKARAMAKAVSMKKAVTAYDLDADYGYCSDGGQASLAIDDTSYVITFSFTNCRDYGTEETGSWRLACTTADCAGLSMTLDDKWTEYDQTGAGVSSYLYTTKSWEDIAKETISFTMNSATKETFTENGTGSFQSYTGSPLYKGEFTAAITYTFEDTSTMSEWSFVAGSNGSYSFTEYTDSGSGFVKDYAESASFGNLIAKLAMNSVTYDYSLSLDGSYTVTLYPADACINGTYVFKTVQPISIDYSTGMTIAGELTINTVVVVKYLPDGSIQVSIDSGKTFSDINTVDWDAMCAEAEAKNDPVNPNTVSTM